MGITADLKLFGKVRLQQDIEIKLFNLFGTQILENYFERRIPAYKHFPDKNAKQTLHTYLSRSYCSLQEVTGTAETKIRPRF